jgi:hypothetical protein
MATRRYGIKPEQAAYQVTNEVGAATVNNPIELTVDFAALAAYTPTMTGTNAKRLVLDAIQKLGEYIEQTHIWPPA